MPKRKIGLDDYNRAREGIRLFPQSFKKAGVAAHLDARTVKRLYDFGLPALKLEPLKSLHIKESTKARAIAEKNHTESVTARARTEMDRALSNAAEAHAQEGQMTTLARQGALRAVASSAHLAIGMQRLAARCDGFLTAYSEKMELKALQDALAIGSSIVTIMRAVNSLAHEAMDMERKHFNAPTQVIEHVVRSEIPLAEAEVQIMAAVQALERAKARAAQPPVLSPGGGEKRPEFIPTVGTRVS